MYGIEYQTLLEMIMKAASRGSKDKGPIILLKHRVEEV
jgi:hypothetical protein